MEQSTPVSPVSAKLGAGQLPSNEGLHDVQQVTTYAIYYVYLLTG